MFKATLLCLQVDRDVQRSDRSLSLRKSSLAKLNFKVTRMISEQNIRLCSCLSVSSGSHYSVLLLR